jgi:hypothetical protein
MKYFVLIAHSPTGWSSMSADEQAESMNDHVRFHQAVGEHMLGGEALADSDAATTLRHVDGQPVLTDGPFAETAEMIGGFYLIDAPDLDTVVEWCRILPHGYSLEIRPCVEIDLPG